MEDVNRKCSYEKGLTLNVDKRNTWHFPLSVRINENSKNVNFKLFIPKESRYWSRCKNCGKSYLDTSGVVYCTRCHDLLKFHYSKEKPSRPYLKKKYGELESLSKHFLDYALTFHDFKNFLNDLFNAKQVINDFQDFFYETLEQLLKNLDMPGNTYHRIFHYEKGKSFKKECNMSMESDFLNIDIKLHEYNHLIRQLILIDLFNIGRNSIRIRSKLISLLKELNFPVSHIQSKIDIDFKKYTMTLILERQLKIISKHESMLEKIISDVQKKNYVNIWVVVNIVGCTSLRICARIRRGCYPFIRTILWNSKWLYL